MVCGEGKQKGKGEERKVEGGWGGDTGDGKGEEKGKEGMEKGSEE